ncbi:replication protein [Achromobacter animicus]|uniref:replication protein n=1 Tax=Achromobacter animicus TaxID=1389935 RepID=UPI0028A5C352|nr:replication protein [Achromobacter animicus]
MTHENTSPQVEDGHTRLANELLEAMCRAGFSARQWAVVMAVVRKTYGYGKKADDISLGQLSSMTGIAKPHVSRAVNDLIVAGVLRRSAGTFGNSLSLNKRYKQWALGGAAQAVTDSVTQGLPKEQPGLPEQQPLEGVTDTATGVTDSATASGVTDSVTGVTDSVRVTDSVTQGLPIREPQKETIQKKEKPLSGKPDSAPPCQRETDAAEAIIAHLNEVTGSSFKPVESNLRLVRGRLGEGYTVEEIRAVIDAKRAEWFGNPRWGKYLRPATLFNATNFAQYAGLLGNVVAPEDGRIDLGNGRYRLNGRIFGADGRPEVVL